jgi:hypothetical protein
MLKSAANPESLPMDVFDSLRAALVKAVYWDRGSAAGSPNEELQ